MTIAENASLPVTLSTMLDIGGLSVSDTGQWTPREGVDGAVPALVGEELTLRQSMPLDASGLDSGRYGYTFNAQALYACSTVSSEHSAELYVQNETDSPYGRGWSIDGLQKLTVGEDGKVAIIDDDGVVTFDPQTSPAMRIDTGHAAINCGLTQARFEQRTCIITLASPLLIGLATPDTARGINRRGR